MPYSITEQDKPHLLCTFASLILFDDKITINSKNIETLIAAAGCKIEPFWPKLYGELLEKKDIGAMLMGSGMAVVAPASTPAATEEVKVEETKKEEPKKEESEEEMGFSLFGDDDDD